MRWFPAALGLLLTAAAAAEIQLTDSDGNILALDSPARRIITLAPNLSELVFAAGAESSLVATVQYSNYPPAARRIPRIGDAFRVDIERVLALRPDLVIAWASGNPPALLDRLEALGQSVWRTEIRDLSDIPDLIEAIGEASGTAAAALEAAGEFRQRLAELKTTYASRARVRYFYQVDDRPLFTVNGEHLISRALSLCGGENVFASAGALAPTVTTEAVVAANPEVLLAPNEAGDPDVLAHWLPWRIISAVANGNLYYLDADPISRATPRILSATEQACTYLDLARSQEARSQPEGMAWMQ